MSSDHETDRLKDHSEPIAPGLYLVATPIGNLEDITLRALRILREVSLIAAEDTRTTRVLLQHYEIRTPLTSYHEHNKLAKLDAIFAALETGDVALVSDAGTPGISDPGYELVRQAIEQCAGTVDGTVVNEDDLGGLREEVEGIAQCLM